MTLTELADSTGGQMADDLIERLRNLRVILKSGDYNGADLMKAWCAMADAADRLEANANKLQRMEEALVEARDLIKQWSPRVYFDVTVAKLDAALKD